MRALHSSRILLGLMLVVLASSACKKTADALLVVGLTSNEPLQEVSSLKASVSTTTGVVKTTTATYQPDGGIPTISTTRVTFGVLVPGDIGQVTVTVQALDQSGAPLASGKSDPVVPRAGATTGVAIVLDTANPLPTDGGAVDTATDLPAGAAGTSGAAGAAGAAGHVGAAGAGAAGVTGTGGGGGGPQCSNNELNCNGSQPVKCDTNGLYKDNGAACAEPTPTCARGACTCTGNQCGSVCVGDFSIDVHHCGGCATDCKIGSCNAARCQPVVLVPLGVTSVAVDGPTLYYTDNLGHVWKAKLDATSVTSVGTVGMASLMVESSGDVYVLAYPAAGGTGTIEKFPAAGGNRVTLASGLASINDLVVGGGYVYWGGADDAGTKIWRTPTTGSGPVTTLATGLMSVSGLAVDDAYVYFTDTMAGTISKVALGGGTVTSLDGGPSPVNIAVDANYVYWTSWVQLGSVWRTPLVGPRNAHLQLGTIQNFPNGLVLDGANLYWSTRDFTLIKASINGGTQTTLPVESGSAARLAVDATSIYFVSGGRLVKAAKF